MENAGLRQWMLTVIACYRYVTDIDTTDVNGYITREFVYVVRVLL